ncbi:MAG: TAXI family TRAP transporter solute-binding subunit [Betaproteobacteria bacterium]|nr:TAXI family TRAP transporter solute-binding subunit [Betaproteobacteria bacterium]MDH3436708.1 TAXI family TRAP transporter solute-binding subunit [Betaproteobacteria bacterium]
MKPTLKIMSLAGCLALAAPFANAETFVRMVSGPSGGSWYPLGAKIMQIMQKEIKGVAASNGPGGGVGNIKDVSEGNAEIGWSYGHTAYNGYIGRGKFDRPYKNVTFFATLYPGIVQIAVPKNSSIKSISDFNGKNLSPGKAGWTGTAFAETVLAAYDLSFAKIKQNGGTVHYVDYSDSVALMKDGHIDVFLAVTSLPQASFIDLNFKPGIRFIGIDPQKMEGIIKSNPGVIATKIPMSAYEGMTADVPTLATATVMVVNKDLPADLVYNMCKVFWKEHGTFAAVKKVWNKVKMEDALAAAAIPVHPGAARCYAELGVKKM